MQNGLAGGVDAGLLGSVSPALVSFPCVAVAWQSKCWAVCVVISFSCTASASAVPIISAVLCVTAIDHATVTFLL